MRRLSGYLKPFLPGIALAIVLLLGQALSDLSLPNYMSDIVNTGIQKSGIAHAAPDALSENGFRLVTYFMSEEERLFAQSAYALTAVTERDLSGELISVKYPKAEKQVFLKRALDADGERALDRSFGAAVFSLTALARSFGGGAGEAGALPAQAAGMDLRRLYQALPLIGLVGREALDAAREGALAAGDAMLQGGGALMAKALYEELGADTGAMQASYILRAGLNMLAIALAGGLASIFVSLLSSRIAAGAARDLRRDLFNKIERFSGLEFDRFSASSLITRCTNDIMQVQMLLMMGIRIICYAPLMGVGGIVMALGKSVSMSWTIAVACAVLIGVIAVVMSLAMPKFLAVQKLIDRLNLIAREQLSGMMVIRAFVTQRHEKKRFEDANRELTATSLFINRVMAFLMPAMMFIMNGATLLIVWVGAQRISESAMQVGDMMAFMQYAMQIIMSFLMISMMFIFVPRAAVSGTRIAEVLYTEESVKDPAAPKAFDPGGKGLVEFRDAAFRYSGAEEDAVSGITFTAKPGETTAIIGATGSGKSTVAHLLMRFYDVSRGRVLVDGVDVREVKQKDLRDRIGFVPQKGVLLSGTVASNLRYGNKDASDEEMAQAARVAQAAEFIEGMPGGYLAPIAQGGTNVSGGQKQRLSIARALAKDPEILLFDDSFSALDLRTDADLRRALKQTAARRTVIIVSQRVGTVMNAERILVMDNGRIVGDGTHGELLKSCRQYAEIAASQLSQEEIA